MQACQLLTHPSLKEVNTLKLNKKVTLSATLFLLAAFPASASEQISWELVLSAEVSDDKTCSSALAEFSRYCPDFSHVDQRLHPSARDWSRGGFQFAWFDFDSDGHLDLFVRVKNADWCGSLGCANYIIFNDLEQSTAKDGYSGTLLAVSNERIFLHTASDGHVDLSFEKSSPELLVGEAHDHLFDLLELKTR
jgi:hypothetical protein